MGAGRQALTVGALHHVEVCVPDLAAATRTKVQPPGRHAP